MNAAIINSDKTEAFSTVVCLNRLEALQNTTTTKKKKTAPDILKQNDPIDPHNRYAKAKIT